MYRNLVGGLQYLTLTHSNIAFAVNCTCQHMYDPSLVDWAQLKHLLCYLKGTLVHELLLH